MFAAGFESLCELGNHSGEVFEEIPEQVREGGLVTQVLDGGEVVEDVEGADVHLVDGKNGRIAANDERQLTETSDPVRYTNR
jgi:hypothetical protein